MPDTRTLEPVLVTVEEAAAMLSAKPWRVRQYIKLPPDHPKHLPSVWLGPRRLRIPVEAIRQWPLRASGMIDQRPADKEERTA